MNKKSKIIVPIIGVLLFVSIIVSGAVTYSVLNENNREIQSSVFVKYENLYKLMQDDTVYIKSEFFEANDFSFIIKNEHNYNEDYIDEVELRGAESTTNLYYLDLTRKNGDIEKYSFTLSRNEDSDKIPMTISVNCRNTNLMKLFNAKKYASCSYKFSDTTDMYYIHANSGSKKCELALNISVKQSYNYSEEELNSIREEIVCSIIDNIVTYNQIIAGGGV